MMPGMNSLWYRFPDCFLLKVHWIVSWGCGGLCCSVKGQEDGEWLQTEHTPVTEPKAKHESSEPMQVRLTSQSYNPYQFQMDESWPIRTGAAKVLSSARESSEYMMRIFPQVGTMGVQRAPTPKTSWKITR
jgi:hypothetical protein